MKRFWAIFIISCVSLLLPSCSKKNYPQNLPIFPQNSIIFQVNSTMPEYAAVVNYDEENSKLAQSVTILDCSSGKEIQVINFIENEFFTENAIFTVDVSFDGNLDILVPYQRAASAVYFQAYIWRDKDNQFVYAPRFENLPNIVIDSENNAILSSRVASQVTSYGISYYDMELKDFQMSHSVFWEPSTIENKMHFKEEQHTDIGDVIIKDCLVERIGGADIDKTDPQIATYFETDSFWRLNDKKWVNTFYQPQNTTTEPAQNPTTGTTESTTSTETLTESGNNTVLLPNYESFLDNLKSNQTDLYYCIKDIDGNGIDDLIIHENTNLIVYKYESSVIKVGEYDFITGTARFLYSDNPNCPGIFYFTVGGGVNHYGYLTIESEKLLLENLWEEHYAAESLNDADRIKALSSNEELISESKSAYQENRDINFIKVGNTSTPELKQNQTNEKYNIDSDGNVWNYLSTLTIPYKSGDNYEIYTDEVQTGYYYIVRDENGLLLDQGYHNSRGSFGLEYRNCLLVLNYGYGANSWNERYYDVSTGRVSKFFPRPSAMSDKLVAYFVTESGQIKLIIQDIFDSSVYYNEIIRDFSADVYKVHFSAEFLDNNEKLRITYPVGDYGETVSETIIIS